MKNKHQNGQILVVILIVMMILGITIVAITNNVVRDVQQSSTSQTYEKLYTNSEEMVLQLTQTSDITSPAQIDIAKIESIFSDFIDSKQECNTSTDTDGRIEMKCSGISQSQSSANISKSLKVVDSPFIESMKLTKDDFVTFKIDPYAVPSFDKNNTFNISLEGDNIDSSDIKASIEVILDFMYTDNLGLQQYSSVRGIFDRTGDMFPNQVNDYFEFQTVGNSSVKNSFSFSYKDLQDNILDPSSHFQKILGSTDPNSIIPVGIRFKLLYETIDKSNTPNIFITIKNTSPQQLIQSRIIEATQIQQNENSEFFGAQPKVSTTIAMFKVPAILDYGLRSENDIQN